MSQSRRIAIVGGTGNVGKPIVEAISKHPARHTLTLISRQESTAPASLDGSVRVIKGDYSSVDFFASALAGQDVLVITLSFMADGDLQARLIRAAAQASVPWILPTEFGSDNSREQISNLMPGMTTVKKQYRDLIVELGVSSFIGIVTNPWIYYYFAGDALGMDLEKRRALFWDEGQTKTMMCTFPQIGKSVAALLSLPEARLERYRNGWAYLKSFRVNQRELLDAVQRVTGTTDADWSVQKKPIDVALKEAPGLPGMLGHATTLFASMFKPGFGGDYQLDRPLLNDDLGLGTEDLDDVVRSVVDGSAPRLGF